MRFQSPSTGQFHDIVLQPVSHGTVCPVITSVDLDKHIETGDTVYTCHVTAQTTELNTSDSDKVQVILEQIGMYSQMNCLLNFLLSVVFITPSH